jgi:membrane glycosyltransferase
VPVLIGLVCGVALTVWTSHSAAGLLARRWGMLLVPEETAPPPELAALNLARTAPAAWQAALSAGRALG